MFRTLRNRLVLSHILPLLVIIPLMGVALITVLERQVYLPALAGELENDARFMAQLAAAEEGAWQSEKFSQAVAAVQGARGSQIMLLDANGVLVASNNPADQSRIGQVIEGLGLDDLRAAPPGEVVRRVQYSPRQDAEVIEVLAPVRGSDGTLAGAVRMSYPFDTIAGEIYQLRTLIFLLLAFGLLLGSGIGYLLAVSVSRPVREVTGAVSALARSSQAQLLNVYGPEEVQLLARSFNDLVTRLRELEQARRQLLANLVHELGRPLGALRSALAALSQGAEKDPELYHDLLSGMDGETARLQRLLNDLSGLHAQVLGALELDRQPLDLRAWLPDALRTWQAAAEEKGIRWSLSADENLPIISGDPGRLAQVLGNLAGNAIKYTPGGGSISVQASALPGQASIAIQDTGPGMTPDELEQIFQPFYRGAHGRRFPQGMGLGLSIARDLTEAHGGRLLVESAPGSGSRFTVLLPAKMPVE